MESADGSALIRRHRVVLQTAAADQGLPRPSAPPGAHNFQLWALRILIAYPAAPHPSTPFPQTGLADQNLTRTTVQRRTPASHERTPPVAPSPRAAAATHWPSWSCRPPAPWNRA